MNTSLREMIGDPSTRTSIPKSKFQQQDIQVVSAVHPAPDVGAKRGKNHYVICDRTSSGYVDAWDSNHVRLPCSPKSLYPIDKAGNLRKRWDLIQDALKDPIENASDLKKAIHKYNTRFKRANNWSLKGLVNLYRDNGTEEGRTFFKETLPFIVELVKTTATILHSPVPLARQQSGLSITLSQLQCACILANSFLCTWSRRNTHKAGSEYEFYPRINFNDLFSYNTPHVLEKIKCLIHYFERTRARKKSAFKFGNVTFERVSLVQTEDHPDWNSSGLLVGDINFQVLADGEAIEHFPKALQADFANKYLGGGVLNTGCVQEEIRFCVTPELMCGMLFEEVMSHNEAIVVTGCEQFSKYSGYSDNFRFQGPYYETLQRDTAQRLQIQVTAMDAIDYNPDHYSDQKAAHQYTNNHCERDLNKVFTAIMSPYPLPGPLPEFATGNWGCGAFGGDNHLKFLQQLMAARHAERGVIYCCFDRKDLKDDFESMWRWMFTHRTTVGQVMRLIGNFAKDLKDHDDEFPYTFFEYFKAAMESLESNDSD